MLTICIMTYYHENLMISLSRLRNYFDYPFKLFIHNDEPSYKLTTEHVQNILRRPDVPLLIHNNDKNVGCFNSRMNVIKILRDTPEFQSQWFIFVDDDDVLLKPKLTKEYAPVINHNSLVVSRLREVLSLIDNPNYTPGRMQFVKEERPKAGCVGIPYDMKTYFDFYETIKGFFPTLYKICGTEKIMEPDDCILMYLFRIYMEKKMNLDFSGVAKYLEKFRVEDFSYALTYLENRQGRYKIEDGVYDLRYGNPPVGAVSYEKLYYEISGAFYKYMGMR